MSKQDKAQEQTQDSSQQQQEAAAKQEAAADAQAQKTGTAKTDTATSHKEELADTEAEQAAEKETKKGKGFFKSNSAKYKEQISELEAEVAELKDKNLRLYAEFENLRKRTARERLELIQSANKEMIETLLPIIDDIDRAEEVYDKTEDLEAYKEGFDLIVQKLRKLLSQKGLQAMDSKEKDFDPEWHEAIAEIPAPNEELKGKVLDVTEKGYLLNDKIIRYAKVVVGK